MTVDTRDVNDLGSGKFRTQAENGTRQICYYNRNKTNTSFNSFLTKREQTSQLGEIKFSIVKVINNINKNNVKYSELGDELSSLNNDNIQSKLQRISESDTDDGKTTLHRTGGKNKKQRQYTGHRRVSKKPRFLSG